MENTKERNKILGLNKNLFKCAITVKCQTYTLRLFFLLDRNTQMDEN